MESEKRDKWIRFAVPAGLVVVIVTLFPRQVALAVQLVLGGVTLAFLVQPLCEAFEKKLPRKWAVLLGVAVALVLVVGLLLLFLPPIARQMAELLSLIPQWSGRLDGLMQRMNEALRGAGLSSIDPSSFDFGFLGGGVTQLLSGTASIAGTVADSFMRLGLSVMLGVYFLLDRESLLVMTELMIPARARRIVLKMAAEIKRGLRVYLRGQVTVSLIVGALAAIGLGIVGVRSPLALGAIVGLFNMIPYFGPILGGIPAVLTALGQSPITALVAVVVLFVVQQLDGMLISPRVMSGATGLSPAAVLLSLAVGGSGWGVAGMLFALPVMLIVRICFRVWASRNEVIEKLPKV